MAGKDKSAIKDEDKAYFIGDGKDEKSARIGRKMYLPGEEIPVDEVDKDRLKDWVDRGIVSIGSKNAPVIVKDTGAIKTLEAEVRDLKAKLDSLPGLKRQNTELKESLKKATSGKKAGELKELKDNAVAQNDRIAKLEGIATERSDAVKGLEADLKACKKESRDEVDSLEADVKEKAALIEKQDARIIELEAEVEQLTAPKESGDSGPG